MNAQVVSFKCVLKNLNGQLISSSFNRDVLTSVPSEDALLKVLAQNLQSLKKGECRSIKLRADEAYGFYDPKKVILFPRKKMPEPLNVRCGQTVAIQSKAGTIRHYRVLQVHGDMISLDGNHPLAGQDLVFEIETIEARDATCEEIEDAQNLISVQVLH